MYKLFADHILRTLLVVSFSALGHNALAQDTGTVQIELSGLSGETGDIYIAVYSSEDDWLGDDTVMQQKVVIAEAMEEELVLTELELPYGDYAFSIFYDVNNNGELDTNWIGIPKEPVAISNNARPSFGPPSYEDAVFTLGAEPVVQEIQIESI